MSATGELAGALSAHAVGIAVVAFFCGGLVKGAIGFALPTVALAISASALPPQLAIALLAVPTLISNIWQCGRAGVAVGIQALQRFRAMIAVLLISLLAATQLLAHLSEPAVTAVMGLGVVLFSLAQLFGWTPKAPPRPAADIAVGAVAGFFGGVSGIWGPPIMLFLVALRMPTVEVVRVAGLAFLLGSVPFILGHLWSGLLDGPTLALSAALTLPMASGFWLGLRIQDRLDAAVLRRVILFALLLAGLNFLRRALV